MSIHSRRHALSGVVVIGVSAEGLHPVRAFFQSLPPSTGAAFIVAHEPAADGATLLPEWLETHTTMRCQRVEDGMRLRPGKVLLVPPGASLGLEGSVVRLRAQERQERPDSGVDACLRSLATAFGPAVIGVLFSSFNPDAGAEGLRAVKEQGGVTMIHDSRMPEHEKNVVAAIRSGAVDHFGTVRDLATKVTDALARKAHAEMLHERRTLELTLLDDYNPVAALIDARDEVLHLFGPTRRYFEPSAARGSTRLTDMALRGLAQPLLSAFREARTTGRTVTRANLRFASLEKNETVELMVRPVSRSGDEEGLLLVVLREQRELTDRIKADFPRNDGPSAPEREVEGKESKGQDDLKSEEIRQKNWFLATLAHELRNPLMPIQHSLAMMREGGLELKERERLIEIAERKLGQLTRLVEDLLDVSQLTQGKLTLREDSLDLSELLREAVEDTRTELEDAGLAVQLELPQEELWTHADAHRLTQAIGNLLDNARKHTPPGGAIRVRAGAVSNEELEIIVEDTGVGIPKKFLAHIFDAFYQGDVEPGVARSGLGVGLALVRSVAEAHGGSVRGESAGPGQGARFILQLPRREPKAKAPPPEPRFTFPSSTSPRRILIVEDHPLAAETTSFVLVKAGHTVAVAHSGDTALERLVDFQPEVLLCDLLLQGHMSGYQLAKAVRSAPETRHLRLVALTGYGEEDRQKAYEAGFDAFLTKPISPAELDRAVTGEESGGMETHATGGEENGG